MAVTPLDLSNTTTLTIPEWAETTNQIITELNDLSSNTVPTIENIVAEANAHTYSVFAQNTYVNTTFASNTYVNDVTAASELLTRLKTVDGPGSGLDADLLDGQSSTYYTSNTYIQTLTFNNTNANTILTRLKTVDGPGSGLDADLLDGFNSSHYLTAAANASYLSAGTIPDARLAAKYRPVTTASATTDWNTITTEGWAPNLLGTSNANAPVSGQNFWCLNVKHNSEITQLAFPHNPISANFYMRRYTGSTWTAWRKLAWESEVALLTGATFTGFTSFPRIAVGNADNNAGYGIHSYWENGVRGRGTTGWGVWGSTETENSYGVQGTSHSGVYGRLGYNEYSFYGNGSLFLSGSADVNGNINVNGIVDSSNNGAFRGSGGAVILAVNGTGTVYLRPIQYNSGTAQAYVQSNGNFTASGNVTAYSDIRVKANIEPISDALKKVLQLNGKTFTRTDGIDTETRHTGLIAQDVQKVLPEAVMEGEDGKLTLAYGNMAGLFVEAFKDLKKENDDLRSELNELKDMVKELLAK